ncbi:MAG TPA: multicopper oxidase, partial [Mobilitalea sp.]|nr:multicopper oxidase [Mobilitalea sp.]
TTIPKYVNALEKPPVFEPHIKLDNGKCNHYYYIDIGEVKQQMLPKGFPKTKVWGYGGLVKNPKTGETSYHISSPGGTFEAIRGTPVKVKWINKLKGRHLFAVDPTLHWANPNEMPMDPPKPWPAFPPGFPEAQKPIPTVTHLHGGEVPSDSDGHPEAWFTHDKKYGPAYKSSVYTYPNEQEATTLWYHDHALGMTRLNVYAGLAGFYLLRNSKKRGENWHCHEERLHLPSGRHEVPLVIQDKMFNTDGSLLFNNIGLSPEVNPYWVPGLLGDTIVVNGKVWPKLKVDQCTYRFRILNASNTRFYNLSMSNGMSFIQIGSDGGLLKYPAKLSSLLIAPSERADILVDFSRLEPGTTLRILNDAAAPFPFGAPPDPETVGQIMQFTVNYNTMQQIKPLLLPEVLGCIETLVPNTPERIVTLNDILGPTGPQQMLLNGQMWSADITETPRVGSTEDWSIVGMTAGAHPIHIHLIQFQLLNRQNYNVEEYTAKWEELNGPLPLHHAPKVVPLEPYLIGEPIPPKDNELGWKDTIVTNPGQVTRIRIRYAPCEVPNCAVEPGDNYFPFNPEEGAGYVWHCHLLDHEDNEMMRPMKIKR